LPDRYWGIFWLNRYLMNIASVITSDIIKNIARKNNIDIAMFLAIHTFGRDLKKNYHIHLSVTVVGMTIYGNRLKKYISNMML
jgi:hypothetical protein